MKILETNKDFYTEMPFNTADYNTLKHASVSPVPWKELKYALETADSVLELGSGTGWLSNRIATNFDASVTGIDLIAGNVSIASSMNTGADFFEENILETRRTADVVISVGVLHHMEGNIRELIQLAVNKAKDYAWIGLYHDESRRAMFDFFNQFPEQSRYDMFSTMTKHYMKSEEQRKSWYRDQFEHPYEVCVSIEDMLSINNATVKYISKNEDVDYYNKTMKELKRGIFSSGFIYCLYHKGKMCD